VLAKALFFMTLTVVSVLAVLPNYNALPGIISYSDIINHITAFFVLMMLFHYAYPRHHHMVLASWMLAYGVLIEIIQFALPTRYGDPFDVISDGIGILVAYAIISKKN
jgi:VanZ family protein